MIVLDASATVELVLNTPSGRKVAERLAAPDETLHAPQLLSIEVAQVVRRYVRSGQLEVDIASDALNDLVGLDIIWYDHELLMPRIWELRDNLTAYDAAYIVLGELLDAPVVTFDAGLAGAPGHSAHVELLASSS